MPGKTAKPAPSPPNLRLSHDKKHCGSCKMFDSSNLTCWGYGNYPVEPNLVCDSYAPADADQDAE